jgi:hypothetical protein
MPYRRFDWHEHIAEVWGEFRSARAAIDRLRAAVDATPDILKNDRIAREYLRRADENLDGTYTSYLTSGADQSPVPNPTHGIFARRLSPKERYFHAPGETHLVTRSCPFKTWENGIRVDFAVSCPDKSDRDRFSYMASAA